MLTRQETRVGTIMEMETSANHLVFPYRTCKKNCLVGSNRILTDILPIYWHSLTDFKAIIKNS